MTSLRSSHQLIASTLTIAMAVGGCAAERPRASQVSSTPSVVIVAPSPTAVAEFEPGQLLRATKAMSLGDWTVRVGQSMYVVARGRERSRDVYTIQHWGDLVTGLRPDTVMGTIPTDVVHASAVPYAAACPSTVVAVDDIAALQPFERLVCFGQKELTFGPVQHEEHHVGTGDPSWFAGESGLDFFTAIPYRPGEGVAVPMRRWLSISGHFDDPSCKDDILCRERFLVTAARPSDPPESEIAGTWKRMAKAPITGRSSYIAVPIDRGTMIWGGDGTDQGTSGAIYEAGSDRWNRIAGAPGRDRIVVAAGWSGREVLIWGGLRGTTELADGLAYEPRRDRWSRIPQAPIDGGFAVGAWTGDAFVVVSANAQAAAWDPASDRWQRLPDPPIPEGHIESVWSGSELIVLGIGEGTTEPIVGAALDPSTSTWRQIADVPYDGLILGIPPRWIGSEMVFVAHAYDPVADRWRALRTAGCRPGSVSRAAVSYGVWTGRWLISQSTAYDPHAGSCQTLPRSPFRPGFDDLEIVTHEFHTPFWADDRLVVWSGGSGLDGPAPGPDGIVFAPSE
jgi:hypothetical protein